jgi:hypothetical protein
MSTVPDKIALLCGQCGCEFIVTKDKPAYVIGDALHSFSETFCSAPCAAARRTNASTLSLRGLRSSMHLFHLCHSLVDPVAPHTIRYAST